VDEAASPAHRSLSEFEVMDVLTGGPGAICVAVYRPDRRLLRRQLESIADQTVPNWVCHIGIDGADPDTLAAIVGIVGDDDRFVIHHFPLNVGFYRNFERTLAAVGDDAAWVALADQDDYWHPSKLERLVAEFAEDDVAAVSGQARLVDGEGFELGLTNRRDPGRFGLLLDNQVTGSFAIFRGDVVQQSLPFPEPTDAAYHDHWLGLVAAANGRIVFVDEALQDYVQHGANVLGEERGSRLGLRARSLRERGGRGGMIRYLATDRWGWRVTMARALNDRGLVNDSRGGVEVAARGRLSFALLVQFIVAILRRRAPLARASALLVGAFAWREPRLTTSAGSPRAPRIDSPDPKGKLQ
jgi:glycosyltransferase involved in cell wall biosynthesis